MVTKDRDNMRVTTAVINSKLDTLLKNGEEDRKEREKLMCKIDNISTRLTVVETTQQTCYARTNYTADKKDSNNAIRSWVQFAPGIAALVITVALSIATFIRG